MDKFRDFYDTSYVPNHVRLFLLFALFLASFFFRVQGDGETQGGIKGFYDREGNNDLTQSNIMGYYISYRSWHEKN